ncbi:iron chelate uptake ABC transporter family permease subunit, partial [Actinotignum timonense]
GLVVVARTPGYTGSLESLLFGSLTGVTNTDVLISLGACVAIGIALAVFHDRIVLVSVDRDFAISTGLRVGRIDVLLHLAIATAVVVSIQTIGNVLVLA